MVGGIALLTLVVNAPTCGMLLKALGIITPSETRNKVVENYRQHMIHSTLVDFVRLLTEKRFQDTDFTLVQKHVSFLSKCMIYFDAPFPFSSLENIFLHNFCSAYRYMIIGDITFEQLMVAVKKHKVSGWNLDLNVTLHFIQNSFTHLFWYLPLLGFITSIYIQGTRFETCNSLSL